LSGALSKPEKLTIESFQKIMYRDPIVKSIPLTFWRAAYIIFDRVASTIFAMPLLSQTESTQKPSFEVISIKRSLTNGPRESGAHKDRLVTTQASLRTLLQHAYSRPGRNGGPGNVIIQVIEKPN